MSLQTKIKSLSNPINPRVLEKRSHLTFEFPTEEGVQRVYVPILENCVIAETQNSNLSEYNLIGRNSSLFAYLSGKSREISLSFKITLPHVIDHFVTEGLDNKFLTTYSNQKFNASKLRNLFFSGGRTVRGIDHAKIHSNYYQSDSTFTNFISNAIENIVNFFSSNQNSSVKNKCINLVIFWLNIIRCSTLNNSVDPRFGPPVIRVTHGPMYNNIPCVAKSYNISIGGPDATYDLETLLSREVDIQLKLHEVRVGNFGTFKSFDAVKGDNLTGWEAVFQENNMDPYNGLIN